MQGKGLYLALDSGGNKTVGVLLNERGEAVRRYRTQGMAAAKDGELPVWNIAAEIEREISCFGMPQRIYCSLGGANVAEVTEAFTGVFASIPVLVEREASAHAVVIGKAITNVQFITDRLIREAGLGK